jgi:hypothetical protein
VGGQVRGGEGKGEGEGPYHEECPDGVVDEDGRGSHEHAEADETVELGGESQQSKESRGTIAGRHTMLT